MSNGTPPITTAPVPPSIAGIPQPVFGSGSATSPAPPIDITGSPIIPTSTPPGGIGQIGDPEGVPTFPPGPGDTAPVAVPVGPQVGPAIAPAPVPPSVPGYPQPQFGSGGVSIPETLFPGLFTTDPPYPPIVFANIMQIGTNPPPSTPGIAPIVMSATPGGPPSTEPPPVPFPNPPLEAAPPININPPTISGTLQVGAMLTASNGAWDNAPTSYAYQWLNNGEPIVGETMDTYTLATTDEGALIAVEVTATNAAGSTSAESVEVGPIVGAGAPPVTLPVVPPQESRDTTNETEMRSEPRVTAPAPKPKPRTPRTPRKKR